MAAKPIPYTTYDEVPYYRKQWFFWVWWFLFAPVAIGVLLTGDVYYRNKGQVRNFGLPNRVVAGAFAVLWFLAGLQEVAGPYYPIILVLVAYICGGLLLLYLAVRVVRMAWRHGGESRVDPSSRKDADAVSSTEND